MSQLSLKYSTFPNIWTNSRRARPWHPEHAGYGVGAAHATHPDHPADPALGQGQGHPDPAQLTAADPDRHTQLGDDDDLANSGSGGGGGGGGVARTLPASCSSKEDNRLAVAAMVSRMPLVRMMGGGGGGGAGAAAAANGTAPAYAVGTGAGDVGDEVFAVTTTASTGASSLEASTTNHAAALAVAGRAVERPAR